MERGEAKQALAQIESFCTRHMESFHQHFTRDECRNPFQSPETKSLNPDTILMVNNIHRILKEHSELSQHIGTSVFSDQIFFNQASRAWSAWIASFWGLSTISVCCGGF
jgi:hypothetical protein